MGRWAHLLARCRSKAPRLACRLQLHACSCMPWSELLGAKHPCLPCGPQPVGLSAAGRRAGLREVVLRLENLRIPAFLFCPTDHLPPVDCQAGLPREPALHVYGDPRCSIWLCNDGPSCAVLHDSTAFGKTLTCTGSPLQLRRQSAWHRLQLRRRSAWRRQTTLCAQPPPCRRAARVCDSRVQAPHLLHPLN